MAALRHLLLLGMLVAWAAACHREEAAKQPQSVVVPTPTVTSEPEPPFEQSALLVWWRDEKEKPTTAWIARTEDGFQELGRTDGVLLSHEQRTWRWRTEKVSVKTRPCDMDMPIEKPPGEGTGMRGLAQALGGTKPVVVVEPELEPANELDHSLSLAGSIGPYLFVRETSYAYACGAHGYHGAGLTVWDLRQQKPTKLVDKKEAASRLQSRARGQLREAAREVDEDLPEEAAELVALLPRYAPDGRLKLGYVFTIFACYACGDGAWGSYTRHTVVEDPPPPPLEPFASSPPELRAFLQQHRVRLGGWSRAPLEKDAPESLRAAFGRAAP